MKFLTEEQVMKLHRKWWEESYFMPPNLQASQATAAFVLWLQTLSFEGAESELSILLESPD